MKGRKLKNKTECRKIPKLIELYNSLERLVYLGSGSKEVQASFGVEEEDVRVSLIVTNYCLERINLKRRRKETACE